MILNPFILCLYPILFLYSRNISELSFHQTAIPAIVSLFITTVIYIPLSKITKNIHQSGFFTSLLIITIFYYSRSFDLLENFGIIIPAYRHNYLIVYLLFFFGYAIYYSRKSFSFFFNTTKFLNLVSYVLIFINLFNIALYAFKFHKNDNSINQGDNFEISLRSRKKINNIPPDIYYVILDEYASSETIRDIFNYDNSSFVNYLINNGFYIAKDSLTSNRVTPAAMASILNMANIKTGNLSTCFNLIRKNKVTSYLNEKGYTIINFPMRYYEDKVSPIGDSDFTFKSNEANTFLTLSNFNSMLIQDSIFRNLFREIDIRMKNGSVSFYTNSTNYIFTKIEKLIEKKGPKFIYAHIECPHPPYVFTKEGKPLDGIKFDGLKFYLDQYIYITTRTIKLIENLIGKSKTLPIIIIQSDHGPNQRKKNSNMYFATKPEHTDNIFNAFLIPNIDRGLLYSDIPPENTFKLVFTHLFSENSPTLND